MITALASLITTSVEIELVFYVAVAILCILGANYCLKINKIWGGGIWGGGASFWFLITSGFMCLSVSRVILILYKVSGYSSDAFTSSIVTLGFLFFILGLRSLYKTLKRGYKK